MATVEVTTEALAQLLDLPVRIQERMQNLFVRLKDWPKVSGAKALRGEMAGYYRMRTGDYRLIFRASDHTATAMITVVRMGHRKDVYDD